MTISHTGQNRVTHSTESHEGWKSRIKNSHTHRTEHTHTEQNRTTHSTESRTGQNRIIHGTEQSHGAQNRVTNRTEQSHMHDRTESHQDGTEPYTGWNRIICRMEH